jgi:hypothetical protein
MFLTYRSLSLYCFLQKLGIWGHQAVLVCPSLSTSDLQLSDFHGISLGGDLDVPICTVHLTTLSIARIVYCHPDCCTMDWKGENKVVPVLS